MRDSIAITLIVAIIVTVTLGADFLSRKVHAADPSPNILAQGQANLKIVPIERDIQDTKGVEPSVFQTTEDLYFNTVDGVTGKGITIQMPKGTEVWSGPFEVFRLKDGTMWFVPHFSELTKKSNNQPIPSMKITLPENPSHAVKVDRAETKQEEPTKPKPHST